jgi:hypothetical protein
MHENKITALYERLSKGDDDRDGGESNSIQNQKQLLEQYAQSHGFKNTVHYTDDDESGRFFDRKGYVRMMEDVESGKIGVILLKDSSRLGRDYIQVGLAMETMRVNGVRLIGVTDSLDTIKEDDFVPFRNVMHEFYAKDTSKKIKSVFKTKGMSGKHCTGTVSYGYLWDEKRENWIIDEEAAEVVRSVFQMTMDGYGPYQIATRLTEKGIEIPAVHLARHGEGVNQTKTIKNPCGWGASTVVHMLKRREYLGHTCNFKTRKHFKDKKSHYVDESEWTIFENTHEAIIDQDTYDNVQRIRGNVRRYPGGWGEAHPLTGILYCADCGSKMYVHRMNNGKRIPYYTCAKYSKIPVGELCTSAHRINAEVIMTLIADMLRAIADYSKNDRKEFIKAITEAQENQKSSDITKKKKRLVTAQKRAAELEKLICRIYEDSVLGKLPQARYAALDEQYAKEQTALSKEISELEAALGNYEKTQKSADKFIALVGKYENFDTVTNAMLNEFVEKIYIHEHDRKGSMETTQQIEIFFNFIGRYVPPHFGEVNLTPEEQEEIRKREERKDRLHQNYLRRKANGKVAEEYERTKAKKKANMDAKKNALRAEDMAKGVYIPASALPKKEPKKAEQTA